jgi:serine/threonine protein kinase
VLPPGLAGNEQFLQRFDREANAISQLNHPHVCTLYDVGQSSGTEGGDSPLHYLVSFFDVAPDGRCLLIAQDESLLPESHVIVNAVTALGKK